MCCELHPTQITPTFVEETSTGAFFSIDKCQHGLQGWWCRASSITFHVCLARLDGHFPIFIPYHDHDTSITVHHIWFISVRVSSHNDENKDWWRVGWGRETWWGGGWGSGWWMLGKATLQHNVSVVFQDQRRASKSLWLKCIIICDPDAFYESHSHSVCVSQKWKVTKILSRKPI